MLRLLILFSILLTGCSTRFSSPQVYYDNLSSGLYKNYGYKYDINYKTLHAICFTESSGKKYEINVNNGPYKGTYNFKFKYKALSFMNKLKRYNYDTGLCQINNQWLKKFHLNKAALLNKYINIDIAAKIYKENIKTCHDNLFCALSLYNTGHKYSRIGYAYARRVIKNREKLY